MISAESVYAPHWQYGDMFHITLRLDKLMCKVRRQADQGPSPPDCLAQNGLCDAKHARSPALLWLSSLEKQLLSGFASNRRMLAQPPSKAPEVETTTWKDSQA